MKKSWTMEVSGVGPVLFERSSRARRLNIMVRPDCRVRVAVPCAMARSQAEELVLARGGWIRHHVSGMQQRARLLAGRLQDTPVPDRASAANHLAQRTAHLAAWHGYRYNRLTIRNQKSRWGSCSTANNISLNMKLLRLPAELADYVILHELVHTRIKNHSPAFWAELERLLPAARRLRAQLNAYPLALL